MPTEIYESKIIYTLDNQEIYLTPLKIKYLKLVMQEFQNMAYASGDFESISVLSDCALITMKQYMPHIKTLEEMEDIFDLKTIYTILDIGAGIKIDEDDEETPIKEQAEASSENSWDSLDLAKLESEVFLLGIWKDYNELEESLSMPELTATLNIKRELDYDDKRFLASIQGVDLDGELGEKEADPWEAMKARVASRGMTSDPNDILSYQGQRAMNAGFGIGMGIDYEDQTNN